MTNFVAKWTPFASSTFAPTFNDKKPSRIQQQALQH